MVKEPTQQAFIGELTGFRSGPSGFAGTGGRETSRPKNMVPMQLPIQQRSRKKAPCGAERLINGAKRIRTADPLHAMQVLYQLSYGPIGSLGKRNAGRSALARRPCLAQIELTTPRSAPLF